jgi:lycopene beta-cyclase
MTPTSDVLVIGSGPAGLIAAAACVAEGLDVVVAAPDLDRPWPSTYGLWLDQAPDAELAGAMRAAWPRVRVRHERVAFVERGYGLVDGGAWQRILRARCRSARFLVAPVEAVAPGPDASAARVGGAALRARVVVDASGPASAFLVREGGPTLYQLAWGAVVDADLGEDMRWMELGDEGTFLYAMPLGDGRAFVEETALVTPGLPLEVLRRRLAARLRAEGVRVRAVHAIERVRIPLDAPVPPIQRVVGFGAAAAMVHPATGYLLPRVLADGPVLARALAAHLDEGPVAAAAAAWRALWPVHRLRQRALHRWGAEVVSRLDPSELRTFFGSFFALPAAARDAWLADALPPGALARAMAEVFARLPVALKVRVATRSAAVFDSIAPRLQEVS